MNSGRADVGGLSARNDDLVGTQFFDTASEVCFDHIFFEVDVSGRVRIEAEQALAVACGDRAYPMLFSIGDLLAMKHLGEVTLALAEDRGYSTRRRSTVARISATECNRPIVRGRKRLHPRAIFIRRNMPKWHLRNRLQVGRPRLETGQSGVQISCSSPRSRESILSSSWASPLRSAVITTRGNERRSASRTKWERFGVMEVTQKLESRRTHLGGLDHALFHGTSGLFGPPGDGDDIRYCWPSNRRHGVPAEVGVCAWGRIASATRVAGAKVERAGRRNGVGPRLRVWVEVRGVGLQKPRKQPGPPVDGDIVTGSPVTGAVGAPALLALRLIAATPAGMHHCALGA